MSHLLFSIITVCFNDREGLERTICSVISQTCKNYEYIVIDGGSTDGSVDVAKKYMRHIDKYVSEPDGGVYFGMNKALDMAEGEFCIFMNAGDCFYSESVLQHISSFGQEYDLGVGVSSHVDENGEEVGRTFPPAQVSLLFWENFSVIHQAAFMRTSMLKERGYDTNYRIVADWKYMFTEYLTREYRYLPMDVMVCKFECGGLSSDDARRRDERNRALRELLPPMLYQDAAMMKGLRFLAADAELRELMVRTFKSRSLRKVLKIILKLLCKLR